MDAAIGRFEFMFNHSLFYAALDCLILLGVARDWVVDKRVHKVYLYALPFEAASLLLLIAIVGAVWMAKRKEVTE